MNLLRSICCLFGGRCAEEEPRPTTQTTRGEAPADLGQREAEREKATEDQLKHMDGGPTRTPRQSPNYSSASTGPTCAINSVAVVPGTSFG
jgi:hypothetical protein